MPIAVPPRKGLKAKALSDRRPTRSAKHPASNAQICFGILSV
jgi:hypothetical protein